MQWKTLNNYALPVILLISSINHFFTFLAYSWYAGIDSYSFDICGLQLVSGEIFDIFPIIYRAPLVPIIKNILYLIFEGHPYLLAVLLHFLGVLTVFFVYRLGNEFHKAVGFAIGIFMALNINITIFYHFISSFTFYFPLLLGSAYRFILWIKKPNRRRLIWLIIMTFFCCMARTEGVILIPVYFIFGGLTHRSWRNSLVFLVSTLVLYNLVCSFYYFNFGYWGVTYRTGWALSHRLLRSSDSLFDKDNGIYSMKIYNYMNNKMILSAKEKYLRRYYMYTFNLAQKDFGYIEADKLFKKAFMEAIYNNPYKFIKYTVLRMLGHLELNKNLNLNYKEGLYETDSGHMWGFGEERMRQQQEMIEMQYFKLEKLYSPLKWEKQVILAKLARCFGKDMEIPDLPDEYKILPNVKFYSSIDPCILNYSDGVLGESLNGFRNLDLYFYNGYWGRRGWSKTALNLLASWDSVFKLKQDIKINLRWLMWSLWIGGIIVTRKRWILNALIAFLCIVLFNALCQAVFSDNFGGRLALYMKPFLWLGFLCGGLSLFEWSKALIVKKVNLQ
ncbi:MAG: hypothetical protein KAJ14_06620 [Candidatus Omnitrophica bacterium]|nr:hypothetical protein [Candidatus Omnitrophota bacterium]